MINDPLLGIFPFFVNLSHPSWIVTLFGVSSISQLLTYNTQFASLHVLSFVSSWSRLGLFIFANESSCCRCSCFVFLLSSNTLSLDFPVFLVAPFYPALKCVCRRSSSSSISILHCSNTHLGLLFLTTFSSHTNFMSLYPVNVLLSAFG